MTDGLTDTTGAVVLPPRLDLSSAPDVAQKLLARAAEDDIEVDASELTHLGTLGVQVLIGAARRAQAAGGQFNVTGLSPRVCEQLGALGLSPDAITEVRP